MTLGRVGHPGLTGFQACQWFDGLTTRLLGVAEALLGIVRLRLTNVPGRPLAAQHLLWGRAQGVGHEVLYGGAVSDDHQLDLPIAPQTDVEALDKVSLASLLAKRLTEQ